MKEHIPSAEELAGYIEWMIAEFGDNPYYNVSRDAVMDQAFNLSGNQYADMSERLLNDPHDAQALRSVSAEHDMHSEAMFISSANDISVGRMLRYLPSHWHSNDYFEVYYSFSGECPVYFLNETVIVRPGTVLIVAPTVVHASPCFRDDCSLLFYIVRSSTFDQVFWNQIPPASLMSDFFRKALSKEQPNSYLHFETGGDRDIRELLWKIFAEYLDGGMYQAQMMNALMSTFFVLLLRRYEGTARLPRTGDFYWKHEYSAILSYIQAHYSTVKLPDLAERFHYSEKQIRRIVESSTGMGFTQLITKLRMEQAAILLKRGDISVEKISSHLGYSSVSGFYRTFSLYYGCPPGQYMKDQEQKKT